MRTPSRPNPYPAFTLLELLIVIGIMAILGVLLAPVTSGLMRAHGLTTASQSVIGQLNLARQVSTTRGAAVQVRFYRLPDYNEPELSGSPSVYRALQIFVEGDPVVSGGSTSTPVKPLSNPLLFNAPVVILKDTDKSTLLTLPETIPTSGQNFSTYGTNYRYLIFRFRADGQADLPDTATGLTLVLEKDIPASGSLPANFCAIEIDPRTGASRSYRP